jgi:hypothetical protein
MTLRTGLVLVGLLAAACSHKPPPTPEARLQSAFDDARGEIRSLIPDKDRAAQVDALLVQLQRAFEQSGAELQSTGARIDELDRRRDATEEQFQAVLATADAARTRHAPGMAAIRERLAGLLTPDEWKKVAAARRRLLDLQLQQQPL